MAILNIKRVVPSPMSITNAVTFNKINNVLAPFPLPSSHLAKEEIEHVQNPPRPILLLFPLNAGEKR